MDRNSPSFRLGVAGFLWLTMASVYGIGVLLEDLSGSRVWPLAAFGALALWFEFKPEAK
jgi:hypothetical protein